MWNPATIEKRTVASSLRLDLTKNSVAIAMKANVVATIESIKPRDSTMMGTTAKSNATTGVRLAKESSGRADTQILPRTAANAAATGRMTNFPWSIIASSARDVAVMKSRSNPASTTGVEARPKVCPTSLAFPFS